MPASMISADTGSSVKVNGSSMAMVGTGPMPGSTPISVPSDRARQAEHDVLNGERDGEAVGEIGEDIHVRSRP